VRHDARGTPAPDCSGAVTSAAALDPGLSRAVGSVLPGRGVFDLPRLGDCRRVDVARGDNRVTSAPRDLASRSADCARRAMNGIMRANDETMEGYVKEILE